MRAAVFRGVGEPLGIEEVVLDEPGPWEVVVETAAAGLCHSDHHFVTGKLTTKTPTVLGHESAGVVVAVGGQVRSVAPGDHVVTCISSWCGECEFCWSGRMWLCPNRNVLNRGAGDRQRLRAGDGSEIHQFYNLSSFAERMLVHERSVVPIPKEMPLDRAALLGCAVLTGVGAVWNAAKVEPGSSVAVMGVGGIGLSCVQGAALAGALDVIAIDVHDDKLELAQRLGATAVVNARDVDPVAAVRELTGGGVDYSFEAVGSARTIEQCVQMLVKAGTCTSIGWMDGSSLTLSGDDLRQSKKIQGVSMGANRFKIDIPRLARFYLSGRLNLDEMIARRIRLDDIAGGFEAMSDGRAARTVVVFDGAGI